MWLPSSYIYRTHQLPAHQSLHDAPFWNYAQRALLISHLVQDDDWAILVDELNQQLHLDARNFKQPKLILCRCHLNSEFTHKKNADFRRFFIGYILVQFTLHQLDKPIFLMKVKKAACSRSKTKSNSVLFAYLPSQCRANADSFD